MVQGQRAGGVMAEGFRHTIGDHLYDLYEDYDGQIPSRVRMYPVVKVTPCFVDVLGDQSGAMCWRDVTYRLSREQLEREGSAHHRRLRRFLYVRPQPDWPLLVVDVRDSRPAAITFHPERTTMTTPLKRKRAAS